jgi:hypothetical protein
MYATCIHCHAKLGANESIEHFPVGRRLAFDAARGRLWVVCRRCGRWNLTPLEERWEAIEECERAFRATKLRMSTENIGLARLGEGVELVRIGSPERPEMAAWRYGAQFSKRRLRRGALSLVVGLFPSALHATGVTPSLMGSLPLLLGMTACMGIGATPTLIMHAERQFRVVTRGVTEDAQPWTLTARHARQAKLLSSPETESKWQLLAVHDRGESRLEGAEAMRVLRPLLARFNRAGAASSEVRDAVARLDAEGGSTQILARTASRGIIHHYHGSLRLETRADTLARLPQSLRLALEMAAHEESERRALEGELAQLERDWQEAEEIAAIADNLLIPAPVRELLARHGRAMQNEAV